MKHIPILFSTPMVQALLEGRKTQTRRVVKQALKCTAPWQPTLIKEEHLDGRQRYEMRTGSQYLLPWFKCPYGQPGDVLWVREVSALSSNRWRYKADYDWTVDEIRIGENASWKPSIHMPKRACRLWLKVKAVRVERLQEISEEDAKAEGIIEVSSFVFAYERQNPKGHYSHASLAYKYLWQSLNGADSWNANPWVWVIEFEPCAMPEDFLTR